MNNGTIKGHKPVEIESVSNPQKISLGTMQAHLSNLKLFNYTMTQDCVDGNDVERDCIGRDGDNKIVSVSSLLKENNNFLKNINDKR